MRLLFLILFCVTLQSFAQPTPFESSKKQETATYPQVINYYEQLEKTYPQAKLLTYGQTDFGKPLHLMVLSKDRTFDPQVLKKNNKRILLINNGIHPGEPEGVDASMMLARDLLKNNRLPDDVVICIIPLYNIGGSYNRSSTSRANQNGPLAYGFRGNSKNYDLNRDFIKTDSKNSQTFQLIFNTWQPDIFVDTHTSNGADYQYTMTLIPTQKDKLNPVLSEYLVRTMLPDLYKQMAKKGFELIPYINSVKETPDEGIEGFLENARYSTGYAALHNVIGFMPETHMLKAFDQRVKSTYQLLETYIDIVVRDASVIGVNKARADAAVAAQSTFPLVWKLNKENTSDLTFKGYGAKYKPSEVSGADRLYYDRKAPYTKNIKEWNSFEPVVTVNKPTAYIIPKAWDRVVELLRLNGVIVKELAEDITLPVDVYYLKDFKTSPYPYEGHYLHSAVQLQTVQQELHYYAGDYVVYVNQPQNRYIVETLEPQATDSFFNWNFFDAVLGQKEHYSAYVFEDTAAALLKENPALRKQLEKEKANNAEFAKNQAAQLDFIYKNSDYYEKTHKRYPITRLVKDTKLPL
ncbi:M14 family metallopeptidase [Pedobacter sp.]|uniref:M14 family metallopeptidase n=1 Tax=Pedobacter sp. TaxID=1411316 RepID=UPI003D7F5CD4